MRGLVLKNHYESTASLAYVVRKEVPGIEIFGGIDLNRSVGGINPAAVERMVMMKGGWGKRGLDAHVRRRKPGALLEGEPAVCFRREGRPTASRSAAGDRARRESQLTLETGHSSAEEGLMIVREGEAARRAAHRGHARHEGAGADDHSTNAGGGPGRRIH